MCVSAAMRTLVIHRFTPFPLSFSLSYPKVHQYQSHLYTFPSLFTQPRAPIPICSLLPCHSNTLHTHTLSPFAVSRHVPPSFPQPRRPSSSAELTHILSHNTYASFVYSLAPSAKMSISSRNLLLLTSRMLTTSQNIPLFH